jgi:hypothetical protein
MTSFHWDPMLSTRRFPGAVLFLASNVSSYINAVEPMVDGGLTSVPFGAPILHGWCWSVSQAGEELPEGTI